MAHQALRHMIGQPVLRMSQHGLVSAASRRLIPSMHQFHPAGVRSVSMSLPRFTIVTIQDEADFKEKVIDSKSPVLIDFYADWCAPCKILGPRMENVVSDQDGKVVLAKVNIDELGELAMEYGVQSVPTVVAMKDGQVKDKFIGVIEDDQLKSFISKLLH